MPQQKDIVKIAIQMPGAYPQLIQLDQVSISTQERSLSQRVEGEKKPTELSNPEWKVTVEISTAACGLY
jgi:hypothetical protein